MDPYLRLPIGELQSVLPEDELQELDFLWRTTITNGQFQTPLLFDKRALSTLYRSLTVDRLWDRDFRQRLIDLLDDEAVIELASHVAWPDQPSDAQLLRQRIASEPWVDSPLTRAFVDALGFPQSVVPKAGERAARFWCEPYDSPLRPLLNYQLDVHDRVLERLMFPNVRLIIQMPTGSGKTLTAMNIVSSFFKTRQEAQAVTRVLWFANAEELCEQAFGSFVEVWQHIGTKPVEVIRSWKTFEFPSELDHDAMVVASFQKAHRLLKKASPNWRADLIVVDEAHSAVAATYLQTMEAMRSSSGRVMGLTATPGRTFRERGENARLVEVFGGEIVGLDFGNQDVIRELQLRGILAVVRPESIDPELPMRIPDDEWKRLASDSGADFSPDFLKHLALNRHRNTTILKKLLQLLKDGEHIVYFATSVAQSRIITGALLSGCYKVAHIDGSTRPKARYSAISEFRQGRIQMISNYGVLSTGFDDPKISCVFIARPTTSIVLYSQMIGRGLRGPVLGGDRTCRLVQVKDNFTNLPFDLDDIYSFFAGYWKSEG